MQQYVKAATITGVTVNVGINGNPMKLYNDRIVYMNSGKEFQLIFNNPTQTVYLAKIKMNGNYISSTGLVLRPGETVVLDRYLDKNRKFKFETYNVSAQNKSAIANNGLIEIDLYTEYVPPVTYNHYVKTIPQFKGYPYNNIGNDLGIVTRSGGSSNITNISSVINTSVQQSNIEETGRIELGSASDQKLVHADYDFNSFITQTVLLQILPESKKPLHINQIRTYCNCGVRRKKTGWKFCPSCGSEF